MNDFDYEVMQKKRAAYGARHKKNGSKSKACGLPSDHLTPAQLRKLSGEVKTYNLDAPMSWAGFKVMPVDLQQEYLRSLNSRFGVGCATISKDLFGKSLSTLAAWMSYHGYSVAFKGKRLSNAEREAWERWLVQEPVEDELPEELPVEEPQEEPAAEEPAASAFNMAKLAVEWEGELDGMALMAQLAKLPLPGGRVRIKLEVEQI